MLTRHLPARPLVRTSEILAAVQAALLVVAFAPPLSTLICACTHIGWFLFCGVSAVLHGWTVVLV